MVKGVADLNELDFDLMVRLIACGQYEKRQCNDKYSYSSKLFAGINRLAALAAVNEQYDMLSDLHECAFIENYAVKPVKRGGIVILSKWWKSLIFIIQMR